VAIYYGRCVFADMFAYKILNLKKMVLIVVQIRLFMEKRPKWLQSLCVIHYQWLHIITDLLGYSTGLLIPKLWRKDMYDI
jgi:hypothetical protein